MHRRDAARERVQLTPASAHFLDDAPTRCSIPAVTRWPDWWHWEIELSSHLLKRMVDRGFSEVDLRTMMDGARGYRGDVEPGRWVVDTSREGVPWEIIVEPDAVDRLLVVITAYAVT